jgi:hypothetical protein
LITLVGLNLVKHVYVLVELIFILLVQITIPPDTFKQHLPYTFFQPKVGEMEIDKMHAWIRVQNLYIAG